MNCDRMSTAKLLGNSCEHRARLDTNSDWVCETCNGKTRWATQEEIDYCYYQHRYMNIVRFNVARPVQTAYKDPAWNIAPCCQREMLHVSDEDVWVENVESWSADAKPMLWGLKLPNRVECMQMGVNYLSEYEDLGNGILNCSDPRLLKYTIKLCAARWGVTIYLMNQEADGVSHQVTQDGSPGGCGCRLELYSKADGVLYKFKKCESNYHRPDIQQPIPIREITFDQYCGLLVVAHSATVTRRLQSFLFWDRRFSTDKCTQVIPTQEPHTELKEIMEDILGDEFAVTKECRSKLAHLLRPATPGTSQSHELIARATSLATGRAVMTERGE